MGRKRSRPDRATGQRRPPAAPAPVPAPGNRLRNLALAIAVSALPVAATLLLFFLIAGGTFSLGGGEKDLFLVLPLALWSVIFVITLLLSTILGTRLLPAIARAMIVATALLFLAWLVLLALTSFEIYF